MQPRARLARWLAVTLMLACTLPATMTATSNDPASLQGDARGLQSWLQDVRRELHAAPELQFELNQTSSILMRHLDALNIEYRHGYAKHGIVATVGGKRSGPTVALRSDMDALPILEPEGLPYRSKHDGAMHACGHDSHMTMLLGAAKLLKSRESALAGTVKLIWQPAEEGGAGGAVMIREGALDGVDAAFGMHVWPALPTGIFATKSGTIMAATKTFAINVHGRGGHAAMPHQNIDPVVAAAQVISALQALVSRETSPLDSVVISVTRIHAGAAYNVIPDTVEFGGTVRTLSVESMGRMRQRVEEVVVGVSGAAGCRAEVDWREGVQPFYPPTVNDPKAYLFAKEAAEELVGADLVVEAETSMGGEDFSFYGQKVPTAFLFLGIRDDAVGSTAALHSPDFILDESVLPVGAAMHAHLALKYLSQPAAHKWREEL